MNVPEIEAILTRFGVDDRFPRNAIANEIMNAIEAEEMDDGDFYDSLEQCILDIMANTDAPFLAAVVAADFVYRKGWEYDNHPIDVRGIRISPGFAFEPLQVIDLTYRQV